MIKYEDDCVGCPPEIGCFGSSCPQRNVPHTYCDRCGAEAKLYSFPGEEEICEDCMTQEMNDAFLSLTFNEKCEIMDVEEVII